MARRMNVTLQPLFHLFVHLLEVSAAPLALVAALTDGGYRYWARSMYQGVAFALFLEFLRRVHGVMFSPLPLAFNSAEMQGSFCLLLQLLPCISTTWQMLAPIRSWTSWLQLFWAICESIFNLFPWEFICGAVALQTSVAGIRGIFTSQWLWVDVFVCVPLTCPAECSRRLPACDSDVQDLFIAQSLVAKDAGEGLFAARPFAAGERIALVEGYFLTMLEKQAHPQHAKMNEYAMVVTRKGVMGVVSPLDTERMSVDERFLWGFSNEPCAMDRARVVEEFPALQTELQYLLGNLWPRFKQAHVCPNAYAHASLLTFKDGFITLDVHDVQEGTDNMSLRTLRPLAVGEEILFSYGPCYDRPYGVSNACGTLFQLRSWAIAFGNMMVRAEHELNGNLKLRWRMRDADSTD